MGIDFKSFMSDIKKGAGKVKRSYAEVVPALKEQKAAYDSNQKAKKLHKKLIDTSTKKEMIKRGGEKEYNKSMQPGSLVNKATNERLKIRKEKEKKYSKLK